MIQESKVKTTAFCDLGSEIAYSTVTSTVFLLVTQVNPVHSVRGFTRVLKGTKDYWELFGGRLHNPPLASSDSCFCLMQWSSDPLPNSSWVSPHYSSRLKSWITSPNWGPGMNEVPGGQPLKYDSSPLADLRTRDRLSISLHKFRIWWDRFKIITIDIPFKREKTGRIPVLKSSRTHVGIFSIRTQSLGVTPFHSWFHPLNQEVSLIPPLPWKLVCIFSGIVFSAF